MIRREPPPIALWMLEHLTSGERDEALAGDLLEVLQSGRADSWYWAQAIGACVVSWFESVRGRASLLVFALLWTFMAPAWNVFCQKAEDAQLSQQILHVFKGPAWPLVALIGWTLLHAIFIWGGLLIFSVLHTKTGGRLYHDKYRRAFLIAPLIFVPVYGILFLTVVLNWYGYFEHFELLNSPWGQIVDVRILADLIRIPYFLASVASLWWAIPISRSRSSAETSGSIGNCSRRDCDAHALAAPVNAVVTERFFVLMVGAGLMNALIAGFLLCRLPESHAPTFTSLCMQAGGYVLAGVLAGVSGTYLYWKNPASPFSVKEPVPFGLFALVCAGGWVWVPAMVLLSEQISPAVAIVAPLGAFALTYGLRRVASPVFASELRVATTPTRGPASLFVESLYLPRVDTHGYAIAISLYSGVATLFTHSYRSAAVLLAFAVSVFAWNRTTPRTDPIEVRGEYKRATLRLTELAAAALLVTAWALLDGVAYRNRFVDVSAAIASDAANSVKGESTRQVKDESTNLGGSGYESVILWPYPRKETVVPPLDTERNLMAPGTKQPLVIRFNGPYWYVQPPHKLPGPMAHQAKGSPLGFNIQSRNSLPLVMDAHQYLSGIIRVKNCREITVKVANEENKIGAISLGILLTDGNSARKPTLYLGEQPIVSTQREHFSVKSVPTFESLRFSLPADAKIRKFNEITVLILPDIEHQFDAPKIAIEQFELEPR